MLQNDVMVDDTTCHHFVLPSGTIAALILTERYWGEVNNHIASTDNDGIDDDKNGCAVGVYIYGL